MFIVKLQALTIRKIGAAHLSSGSLYNSGVNRIQGSYGGSYIIVKPHDSPQGKNFVGDLLTDGKIRWVETGQIFNSPSAWATHCKRLVNPAKKSGCGWASVRYRGQKLVQYKTTWLHKYQPSADMVREPALLFQVLPPTRVGVGFNVGQASNSTIQDCFHTS